SPVGGINKDKTSASHGHLHSTAAEVATNATVQLLEDIRVSVGDSSFLRLMGITRSSVLCFVIDTTGGMSDVIKEAKRVASSIIDSTQGTANEPSDYILVAFNSSSASITFHFWRTAQNLLVMTLGKYFCLTVVHLLSTSVSQCLDIQMSDPSARTRMALRAVPASSYIFVFADAPAKDSYLMSTVTALIESTRSVVSTSVAISRPTLLLPVSVLPRVSRVNFMLTNPIVSRRRRSYGAEYVSRELAQASGGLAIEVAAASLPQATNVIVDSTTSALATLLQATRNPGKADDFSFVVDTSVQNMIMYITGSSLSFTLQNPSGVSQSSGVTNGPLGTIQAVGNLYRVQLNQQVGPWRVSISSNQPYSLKVTGQSSINFRFDFVKTFSEPVSGYIVTKSRPNTGGNATLLLTVISSSTVNVTEVSLVEVLGSGKVNGTIKSLGQGDYLVSVDKVPDFQFGVRLAGLLDSSTQSSNALFQRQSNTQPRSSNLTVTVYTVRDALAGTVDVGVTKVHVPLSLSHPSFKQCHLLSSSQAQNNSILQPGSQDCDAFQELHVWIDVCCNERHFDLLNLVNGSAQGVVSLSVPANTPFFGSDTTVSIVAESPGTNDTNYVVLRLSGAAEAPILTLSLGLWPGCATVTFSNFFDSAKKKYRRGNE
ncbi:hypothetical protein Z043_124371, partial [Scleropages formosus]